METGDGGAERLLLVSETLRVLSDVLRACGAPPAAWFKESSQKNLKSRDFLLPRAAMAKTFPGGGEVPEEILQKLAALDVPGILPVRRCLQTKAGLSVQLDRPATFHQVLKDFTPYLKPIPPSPDSMQSTVILNCAPLHACTGLATLKLSHLRAVLLADHLAEVLRLKGEQVRLIPPIRSKEVSEFLKQLRVTWPSAIRSSSTSIEETVLSYKDSLKENSSTGSTSVDSRLVEDESSLIRVHLRSCAEKLGLSLDHYDPNIDHFMDNLVSGLSRQTVITTSDSASLKDSVHKLLDQSFWHALSIVAISQLLQSNLEVFRNITTAMDDIVRLNARGLPLLVSQHCSLWLKQWSADNTSMKALTRLPCLDDIVKKATGVGEGDLTHVAYVQDAVQESLKKATSCSVLHVVSFEGEFHQQKLDLLWRLLDPGASAVTQKHLICGPVKVLLPVSLASCSEYFHLRKAQMQAASIMKYGDSVQGESWDEIITSLTSAAVKFELMATPHRSQVTLNLEDTNITTKGTKSGAFVMYNCARLSTMFDSYNSAVSQGLYPEFPSAEQCQYSSLNEEGEWLLLFNYILMFPEVLGQVAQISLASPGLRVTGNTESVCKFLVNLSMDFSCYYNRVHILGEPLPHLFGQMFARLQLMKAVRSVLHAALATLHIQPLAQI
ncbi:DALR anticodon-binding domain-containing protein 3 [Gastrophryne carolinensis]